MEIIIANKTSGKMWNVTNSTTGDIELAYERMGAAAKLTFTLIKAGDISFFEGDVVRFTDENTVFYGWVFTKEKNRWNEITVTCYDRLRYLMTEGSFAFYNKSVGDIVKQLAGVSGLTVGEIAETGYKIPSLIESGQKYIDIIQAAINQTLLNTGKLYVLYDNGDGLSLADVSKWRSELVVGERSLLTDYTYTTDIDEKTYNRVTLARPDEAKGYNQLVAAQDSDNIERWGLLTLYKTVDESLNTAQMQAQAQATLKYYNRRRRSLSCSAIGINGLRAGMMIYLNIPDLGDVNLHQYVVIDSITHTWSSGDHSMEFTTMELE